MKMSPKATGALYMKSIRQEKRIAELEKNISMLEQYNGSIESLIKDIEAHNLEQQAKALTDAHKVIVKNELFRSARNYIDYRALELLEQAKALKEGK
jgi:DNA integrity scanning protein DisA with diadenylate cyclase activity